MEVSRWPCAVAPVKTVRPSLYGEVMLDPRGLQAGATLSLVSTVHRTVIEQECRLVELAAHWADLHHPASRSRAEQILPGAEQARVLGGDGTPEVLEFSAAELGARLETTVGSARALMADALDLRHRLPGLWQLIIASRVRVWQARKVAQATRHLSLDAAKQVDAGVAQAIIGLPWHRFQLLLQAKIIEADPKAAEEQAKIWEAERFVRSHSSGQSGFKLIIARANAGDVVWFMATVNRIAEILRLRGDFDSADVRRSKAIGILGQPAVALQLLWEFRDEHHPAAEPQRPDEPIDNEPDPKPDCSMPAPVDSVSAVGIPEQHGGALILRPAGVDLDRLRPKVVLHVHLSQEALLAYRSDHPGGACGGSARLEAVGPVTLGHVHRFLAQTGCQVTVQPIIDPSQNAPVDSYEIPRRIREAMFLRQPASCFPYSPRVSRRVDLDHTIPYLSSDRGGPPGQTEVANLGPLSRFEHRLKTHGRWQLRQPEAGVYLWRSPSKTCYLVTDSGTHTLGEGEFARTIWQAARLGGPVTAEDAAA